MRERGKGERGERGEGLSPEFYLINLSWLLLVKVVNIGVKATTVFELEGEEK